jgi:hypothetical protein
VDPLPLLKLCQFKKLAHSGSAPPPDTSAISFERAFLQLRCATMSVMDDRGDDHVRL